MAADGELTGTEEGSWADESVAPRILGWGQVNWTFIVQNDPSPIVGLSYRRAGTPQENRFAAWFRRRPHWLIALVLLIPVYLFDIFDFEYQFTGGTGTVIHFAIPFLFIAVCFIAGAVRRLNWRHVLVMLVLAGAWYGLQEVCSRWSLFTLPFPYSLAIWAAGPVIMIGVGEWLLVCPRSSRSLIWVLVLSVAVGFLIPLIHRPVYWTGAFVSVRLLDNMHRRETWGEIIYWPLVVVLTWIALPAAIRVGRSAIRSSKYAVAGTSIVVAGAFFLFFNVVMYQLAHRSLVRGGPFTRDWAVAVLGERYSPSDQHSLWDALEQADWSKPKNYESPDYRRRCLNILSARDRPGMARRLAQILRDKPSEELADLSAGLLAQERRYEAAPELMRYALLGNSQSTEALEAMTIPEAALPIIRDLCVSRALSSDDRSSQPPSAFVISARERARLAGLLGKDVGPNLDAWISFYDATYGKHPTPVSTEVSADIGRVTQAIASYWTARDRLGEAKQHLLVRRLQQDGKDKYLEQMRSLLPLMNKQGKLTDADIASLDPVMISQVEQYEARASRDTAVTLPNWEVAGTSALEHEVAHYASRVEAIIARYHLAATRPATTLPTTNAPKRN